MSLADLQEHIICFEMFMIEKKELEAWLELAVSDLSRFIYNFDPLSAKF